jgi:hypothetical protein
MLQKWHDAAVGVLQQADPHFTIRFSEKRLDLRSSQH